MTDYKDTIIIDLDNTLTQEDAENNYSQKIVNQSVSMSIKNAISLGYESKIFSARNMRSLNGDLNKIESITRPIAEAWLKQNNIDYEELILGKPWCGYNGWYLDDKNISIEEFIFKFSGPYWDKTVNIVIPFFNEEKNILIIHPEQKKIERLLNVTQYIYIDNGSSDNTFKNLKKIASQDKKVKVISIKKNLGYGHGIKKGLQEVGSDLVLLNHADLQFDPHSFFLSNLSTLIKLNEPLNILPQRLNRPLMSRMSSAFLRFLLSILYFHKMSDFNGQPKLFFIKKIKNIDTLPDNFCIDLALYNLSKEQSITLPIIQRNRHSGKSSWNTDFVKRIKIFLQYLLYAIQKRKK